MGSASKDLRVAEGTLRIVIENLIDAQECLQTVGEAIRSEVLKRYFLAESLVRAQYRGELETILHQEGVRDVEETGSPEGKFVRVWTQLKRRLGASDHSLLTTAEEVEASLLQAYAEALDRGLALPISEQLASQASHVKTSQDYIRAAQEGSK